MSSRTISFFFLSYEKEYSYAQSQRAKAQTKQCFFIKYMQFCLLTARGDILIYYLIEASKCFKMY